MDRLLLGGRDLGLLGLSGCALGLEPGPLRLRLGLLGAHLGLGDLGGVLVCLVPEVLGVLDLLLLALPRHQPGGERRRARTTTRTMIHSVVSMAFLLLR